MVVKFIRQLVTATISAAVLFTIGLVVWFFRKDSQTLQDILFWAGAIPVALFSIASMGGFAGRGDPSYQLSRSVSEKSSNQRALQEVNDIKSRMSSGLNWCIAGLLVLLLSSFL